VRGFEYLGGVPGRVRYDNLKPAVVRVLRGRNRNESDRFILLRSHYGFDSFFCIPGEEGAHEKGGVEGEVGRFRRRRLVPVPRVGSLSELNELCAAGDEADDRRHIFGRAITVGEHFAIEKCELGPLPEETLDFTLSQSDDLYELVCSRAGKPSIFTANRQASDWYSLFPNPVVSESILDRIVNSAHHVHMDARPYRPTKRPGGRAKGTSS
jgi:hypothetical protein